MSHPKLRQSDFVPLSDYKQQSSYQLCFSSLALAFLQFAISFCSADAKGILAFLQCLL